MAQNYTFLDELKDKMSSHRYSEARQTYAKDASLEGRMSDLEDKFTIIRDKFEDVLEADASRHVYSIPVSGKAAITENVRTCVVVKAKITQLKGHITAIREKTSPVFIGWTGSAEDPKSTRVFLATVIADLDDIYAYMNSIERFCRTFRYDKKMNDAALDPIIVKRFDGIVEIASTPAPSDVLIARGLADEILNYLETCTDVTPIPGQYIENLSRYLGSDY